MDLIRLFEDFGIPYKTEGHKHCRPGWIQIECPFCSGNPGYHLGYCFNKEDSYYDTWSCWRCGWKPIEKVLTVVLNIPLSKAKELLRSYSGEPQIRSYINRRTKGLLPSLNFPIGTGTLGTEHRRYLRMRLFDPERIEVLWDVKGTGPVGPYKNRIIVPIYKAGKLVSYQGRDITDRSELKYKACKKEDEIIHHKDFLYGLDYALEQKTGSVMVVEGVFDVWRMGPGAVATFGIKYRTSQLRLLAESFDEFFIMYDFKEKNIEIEESQSRAQAKKMKMSLLQLGKRAKIITSEKANDPGALPQEEANKIRKELGFSNV